MPIAIAPIDRQPRAVPRASTQGGDQRPILRVDRALAAEVLVMFGDFQHALPRHVLAAQHVFEKRQDVFRSFGSAKRNDQDGIVGARLTEHLERRESRPGPLRRRAPICAYDKMTPTGFEPVLSA